MPAHLENPSEQDRITKRKVVYLSGYDPRGASHYHTLYCQEAGKAERITHNHYHVAERRRNGRFSSEWKITADHAQVDYEFLSWDDIIRHYWPKHPLVIIAKSAWMYGNYVATGAARRIYNTSRTHFFTFVYPLIFLTLLALVAAASAVVAANAAAWLLPGTHLEWLVAPLAGYGVFIKLGEYLENRFDFYWILRVTIFSCRLSQERVAGFDERIDSYAEHLLRQCSDDAGYDEVLLVGHSIGTVLLPMVLSRALEMDAQLGGGRQRLAILTLGHCIQDVTFLPGAARLRKAICHCLAEKIFWLDVTSPPDGACYPLVDVALGSCERTAEMGKNYPIAISARFHKMFGEAAYKKLKRDRKKLHFHYLMSGDYQTEYNYFDITAGQASLAARYASYFRENPR